jgi:hypothetical protein
MIAALFALAAAMIIGGCAAVIQGFPYVRLESGLAMVIAGSVAASSGAVLLGLGVVALGFRRVERAIGQAPAAGAREAVAAAPAADEGRTRPSPVLPTAPAFVATSVVEPPFDPERLRIEPTLPQQAGETHPPAQETAGIDAPKPVPAELGSPRAVPPVTPPVMPPVVAPEPDLRAETDAKPAPAIAPEDDLFAAPEPAPDATEAPPLLRPSLDTPAGTEPESKPAPEPAPEPAARTVVGRYASGGNTYVMFEDGSIEAETPQGRFTFASLDELKAFVDGGGESGARGAA